MNVKRGRFGVIKKEEFLRLLREGGRRHATARAVGIHPETFRLHYNADPVFAQAVDRAEMEANEQVEDALYQAALSGNVVACQVWLYNRNPDDWKDKRNVEHSGTIAVGTMNLDNCSGDELRQRLADAAQALLPGGPGTLRETRTEGDVVGEAAGDSRSAD